MKKITALLITFAMLVTLNITVSAGSVRVALGLAKTNEAVSGINDKDTTDSDTADYGNENSGDNYTFDYDPDSEICPPPIKGPDTNEKGREYLKGFCEWIIKGYNEHKNDETDSELFLGYHSEAKNIAKNYLDHPEIIENMDLAQTKDEFYRLRNILETIKPEALDELIMLASKEINENDYCEEKLWREFASKYDEAKKRREGYSHQDYYDLKRLFGRILQYNTEVTIYDVNRDTELNLLDVTIVQKYLAQLAELSCSQMLVVSTKEYGDINMATVTQMQKIVAGLKDPQDVERGTGLYYTEFSDEYLRPLMKQYSTNIQIDLYSWQW